MSRTIALRRSAATNPPRFINLAEAWHWPDHEMHDDARDVFGEQEPGWLDYEALSKAVARLQPRAKMKAKAKAN